MTTDEVQGLSLLEARQQNRQQYGDEAEARAYAEDLSAEYCERCFGVFHAMPGEPHQGHECPAAGAA